MRLVRVKRRLEGALLRWAARQVHWAQIWSQITRGPRYVGGFTARAFAFLENATGFDAERDLQHNACYPHYCEQRAHNGMPARIASLARKGRKRKRKRRGKATRSHVGGTHVPVRVGELAP